MAAEPRGTREALAAEDGVFAGSGAGSVCHWCFGAAGFRKGSFVRGCRFLHSRIQMVVFDFLRGSHFLARPTTASVLYAAQREHQIVLSDSQRWCPSPCETPRWSSAAALSAHRAIAEPVHGDFAMRFQSADARKHTVHFQPLVVSRRW